LLQDWVIGLVVVGMAGLPSLLSLAALLGFLALQLMLRAT
jgi:hypothetical protein